MNNIKPKIGKDRVELVLPGSIRSKKNSKTAFIVGGKNKPRRAVITNSKAYKKWESRARPHAIKQLGAGFQPWKETVRVYAAFYYNGNEPDLQGCFESIADCLEGIVYVDDKQIIRWHGDSHKRYCSDRQFTHVIVEKFKEDNPRQGNLF